MLIYLFLRDKPEQSRILLRNQVVNIIERKSLIRNDIKFALNWFANQNDPTPTFHLYPHDENDSAVEISKVTSNP